MEDASYTRTLEQQIAADGALAGSLRRAQQAHRKEWSRAFAKASAFADEGCADFSQTGNIKPPNIAAAGDEMLLKCLHAHFAWYLVHPEYKPGQLIAAKISSTWCSDDRCSELAPS